MQGANQTTGPILSPPMAIEPDWIDHNGHLNMAYYLVLFDRASDMAFATLGLGPPYAGRGAMATFTGDAHIAYLREVRGDRPVICALQIIDHDDKAIHAFQQMRLDGDDAVAATCETLTLHVDRSIPAVRAFPAAIAANVAAMARQHALLPRPDGVGRRIGIRRRGAGR